MKMQLQTFFYYTATHYSSNNNVLLSIAAPHPLLWQTIFKARNFEAALEV